MLANKDFILCFSEEKTNLIINKNDLNIPLHLEINTEILDKNKNSYNVIRIALDLRMKKIHVDLRKSNKKGII
jgi:hypothetical protein